MADNIQNEDRPNPKQPTENPTPTQGEERPEGTTGTAGRDQNIPGQTGERDIDPNREDEDEGEDEEEMESGSNR